MVDLLNVPGVDVVWSSVVMIVNVFLSKSQRTKS